MTVQSWPQSMQGVCGGGALTSLCGLWWVCAVLSDLCAVLSDPCAVFSDPCAVLNWFYVAFEHSFHHIQWILFIFFYIMFMTLAFKNWYFRLHLNPFYDCSMGHSWRVYPGKNFQVRFHVEIMIPTGQFSAQFQFLTGNIYTREGDEKLSSWPKSQNLSLVLSL